MMGVITRHLKLIRGWWRWVMHFCPSCNSDAPNMYDCRICKNRSWHSYPWGYGKAARYYGWRNVWNRFKKKSL